MFGRFRGFELRTAKQAAALGVAAPLLLLGSACSPTPGQMASQSGDQSNVQGGAPQPEEDLSWIPAGFNQINRYVAYRLLASDEFDECEDPTRACIAVQVATSETCMAGIEAITTDSSNQILEELLGYARVPVGTIGTIYLPLEVTDGLENIQIFDGDCYFDLSD